MKSLLKEDYSTIYKALQDTVLESFISSEGYECKIILHHPRPFMRAINFYLKGIINIPRPIDNKVISLFKVHKGIDIVEEGRLIFECNHYEDLTHFSSTLPSNDEYRTIAYVREELNKLSKQVSEAYELSDKKNYYVQTLDIVTKQTNIAYFGSQKPSKEEIAIKLQIPLSEALGLLTSSTVYSKRFPNLQMKLLKED